MCPHYDLTTHLPVRKAFALQACMQAKARHVLEIAGLPDSDQVAQMPVKAIVGQSPALHGHHWFYLLLAVVVTVLDDGTGICLDASRQTDM